MYPMLFYSIQIGDNKMETIDTMIILLAGIAAAICLFPSVQEWFESKDRRK